MSATGRTIWWGKDAAWWRRERIVALGEEFGADGPAVLDWLACEAKAQNDGGWVKSGVRSIARGCFVKVEVVREVLSRAVTLGALDDFSEDSEIITCRVSGFQSDDARARAAIRQAAKRSRDAGSEGDSHAPSPPVTPSHAEFHREENRREEEPPNPPRGGRERDKLAFADQMQAWASDNFPAAQPSHVSALVSQLRTIGIAPTVSAMRQYAAEHPVWSPGIVEAQAA